MKKLLLLLLFITLVSFGQEDVDFDSNLNLTVKDNTKNYFGIGFKFESKFSGDILDGLLTEDKLAQNLLNNMIVIDLNYVINNFYFGAEYGINIHQYYRKLGNDVTKRNIHKFGLRIGSKILNDKFIFTSTNGIHYKIGKGRFYNGSENTDFYDPYNYRKFYTKFSVILNLKNKLFPEIGIGTDGFSLGLVYFFKPKSSKNKKLKNNEDVYTELKKLNELLELGIITQEEYVKKAEELKKVILD
ncbi:hypothetical protein N9454_06870 [Flavobacteriaceae bacterium]|nr:hypothetical protein [Flavobacteriaceae bacterium]